VAAIEEGGRQHEQGRHTGIAHAGQGVGRALEGGGRGVEQMGQQVGRPRGHHAQQFEAQQCLEGLRAPGIPDQCGRPLHRGEAQAGGRGGPHAGGRGLGAGQAARPEADAPGGEAGGGDGEEERRGHGAGQPHQTQREAGPHDARPTGDAHVVQQRPEEQRRPYQHGGHLGQRQGGGRRAGEGIGHRAQQGRAIAHIERAGEQEKGEAHAE